MLILTNWIYFSFSVIDSFGGKSWNSDEIFVVFFWKKKKTAYGVRAYKSEMLGKGTKLFTECFWRENMSEVDANNVGK